VIIHCFLGVIFRYFLVENVLCFLDGHVLIQGESVQILFVYVHFLCFDVHVPFVCVHVHCVQCWVWLSWKVLIDLMVY
jgi:hypothetical protein